MFLKYLYSKKKSSFWVIFKQLRELIFALANNNFLREKGTIWIHPYFPSRKSTLYQITRKLKISLVTQPFSKTRLGIYFHDSTIHDVSSLPKNLLIINKEIYDISKKKVDEIHQNVFGYNTIVDPTTYTGLCVSKSNDNALHDGEIISCPISSTTDGKIYQIIINNQEGNLFIDYRVCVMKSEIVIVYKKFKLEDLRFTNDTSKAIILDHDVIPENIKKKIISFTQNMKAEFCELDVLQDKNTGNWYIIDLNKTPYGPPASLSKIDKNKAVEILSNGFSKNFLNY